MQYEQCRSYGGNLIFIYKCPNCGEGCIAKKLDYSGAPEIKWLVPKAEDPTTEDDFGGVKVDGYDIIAASDATDQDGNSVYWS
ncbi:hypothetical protein [Calothrix sp. CCY 0018]|uniref:hypothetical protein n=1 Tax=Calothrix sp. CCY 0018 TaxID=3103864 RepID=UPI0039C63348